ncbi:Rne/Rng family ribonuclease [uncultured Odoribacter sp.]|uniref:Rne/Rng family ribonuclease n=1 Tax=uncultured Odoribacter sp. TaxID=876416 RepID=UPI00263377A7|nr:Rne/Rng family ribonuclease [uncultured Odoribacter sp.]
MNSELVIDVRADEIIIALLREKKLIELTKEKTSVQFAVGDIYLGKVKKIMPGLNAAFVNVGYEKDAFLHYLDLSPQFHSLDSYIKQCIARKGLPVAKLKLEPEISKVGKISDILTVGQWVAVQVAKEPISTKGPRLTSELSIAGRNLVLMPFSEKVSVSQKIKSPEERKRLKRLIESIRPKNYGVIVRTVAEGKKVAQFDSELKELVERFETAFKHIRDIEPPKLILGEIDRTSAFLRDILNPSFENIYVNDITLSKEIKHFLSTIAPEKEDIVKYVSPEIPILDHFGVDKQIKSSLGKTVSFKNGAYLIIEHTEAFHVIDVNSGNRAKLGDDQESNALEVNLAAAEEVARQLQLRDMGGIIVIDFIDMQLAENRQKLFDKMKTCMEIDRAKHTILPLSKFGLMQITRQRVRPEMTVDTMEVCPVCHGTGKAEAAILVIDKIEDQLEYIAKEKKCKNIVLKVHPFVGAYLKEGFFSLRLKWAFRYRVSLKVVDVPSYYIYEYHFYNQYKREIAD